MKALVLCCGIAGALIGIALSVALLVWWAFNGALYDGAIPSGTADTLRISAMLLFLFGAFSSALAGGYFLSPHTRKRSLWTAGIAVVFFTAGLVLGEQVNARELPHIQKRGAQLAENRRVKMEACAQLEKGLTASFGPLSITKKGQNLHLETTLSGKPGALDVTLWLEAKHHPLAPPFFVQEKSKSITLRQTSQKLEWDIGANELSAHSGRLLQGDANGCIPVHLYLTAKRSGTEESDIHPALCPPNGPIVSKHFIENGQRVLNSQEPRNACWGLTGFTPLE